MFSVAHKWARNLKVSFRFYKHFVPTALSVRETYCFRCSSFNRITALSFQ